jgi:hypothetical protein
MDTLQAELSAVVEARLAAGDSTAAVYQAVRAVVGLDPVVVDERRAALVPRLSEPWFCCAEPTAAQLAPLTAR